MAQFTVVNYKTSELIPRVLPLRMSLDLSALGGGGSVSDLTGSERVHAPGRSRKAYGIHARYYTIARRVGAPGDYNASTVRVKVVATSDGQMLKVGTIVTYKTRTDWQVVSNTPELIK